MLRILVAIQFSISTVVATNLKSIAHRDSEKSTAAAFTQVLCCLLCTKFK